MLSMVVLSRDQRHFPAMSLAAAATRITSRAKLPRPKRLRTSRTPVLYPSLPAALAISTLPSIMSGSESTLLSAFQLTRYDREAISTKTARTAVANPMILTAVAFSFSSQFFQKDR